MTHAMFCCAFFPALIITMVCITSCSNNPLYDDMGCPFPMRSDISQVVQVFYSPFENQTYATINDTVGISKFRYNFELEFAPLATQSGYHSTVLDACPPQYNVQNISNIQIFLTSRFYELPPGTDISYLFTFLDGTQLSRFRDFTNMKQFNSLEFNYNFVGMHRLNTRFVIFLKNGDQLILSSTSPVLIN